MKFLTVAPGIIWTALIVGLMLLADWLATYFGAVAWVAPLAGLLAAVIVPILKVLAENQVAPVGLARDFTVRRSAWRRWLL
jgi:hypothetical protein